ncbi:MAG: acyl-CoA dehydrogenase family protein [Caulobacteraceae bacterium]
MTTPAGFKDAYRTMVESGWTALSVDPQWGGQGLPLVLNLRLTRWRPRPTWPSPMYPGLTHGAFSASRRRGTRRRKRSICPGSRRRMAGAMCLTEPQCGTDLGLIRTKATKADDGTWRITGEKIWISGGEHDLAPNIVHLVLARTEGAPAGTRGLSLFICPKFIPDETGAPGERNGFKCAGLEERWASTATPPASWPMRARPAGCSARRPTAFARCS